MGTTQNELIVPVAPTTETKDDALFEQQQNIISEQAHTIKTQSETIAKLVTALTEK